MPKIINSLKFCFTLLLILSADTTRGQSVNSNWKESLSLFLDEFMKCTSSGGAPCSKFIGESVQKVYKISDFYAQENERYMTVSEIASFLKNSKQWSLLGPSYQQATLTTAQTYANEKKAVVAVYLNSAGVGHVALIIPGELRPSGSWGLSAPSAASFFPAEPEKSFVDKALSYGFAKNMLKDVLIYGRNY
jgi:hypothetical protein